MSTRSTGRSLPLSRRSPWLLPPSTTSRASLKLTTCRTAITETSWPGTNGPRWRTTSGVRPRRAPPSRRPRPTPHRLRHTTKTLQPWEIDPTRSLPRCGPLARAGTGNTAPGRSAHARRSSSVRLGSKGCLPTWAARLCGSVPNLIPTAGRCRPSIRAWQRRELYENYRLVVVALRPGPPGTVSVVILGAVDGVDQAGGVVARQFGCDLPVFRHVVSVDAVRHPVRHRHHQGQIVDVPSCAYRVGNRFRNRLGDPVPARQVPPSSLCSNQGLPFPGALTAEPSAVRAKRPDCAAERERDDR